MNVFFLDNVECLVRIFVRYHAPEGDALPAHIHFSLPGSNEVDQIAIVIAVLDVGNYIGECV